MEVDLALGRHDELAGELWTRLDEQPLVNALSANSALELPTRPGGTGKTRLAPGAAESSRRRPMSHSRSSTAFVRRAWAEPLLTNHALKEPGSDRVPRLPRQASRPPPIVEKRAITQDSPVRSRLKQAELVAPAHQTLLRVGVTRIVIG
jgi:hypothetical protein